MRLLYSVRGFLDFIRNTVVFFILVILDAVLVGSYVYFSRGLEKPAGVREAVQFFINNPNDYGASFFTGILAYMLIYALVLAALINLSKRITIESSDSLVVILIEIILVIILIVVSTIYLKGVGVIAFVTLFVAGLVSLGANASR